MNWWSAQNWCEAQGRVLASRADVGCGAPCGDTSINRYCRVKNCDNSGYGTAYKESVLNILQTTEPKWNNGWYWLEDYGNNRYAYYGFFDSSYIHDLVRNRNEGFALCH